MAPHELVVQDGPPRGDGDRPPAGHRVPGIHHEVDENLLDLAGVGDRRAGVGGELEVEHDVLAEDLAKHGVGLSDHPVEVEDPGLGHLPAAEREELSDQPSAAVGCLQDLGGAVPLRAIGWEGGDEHLGEAGHGGEEVVEVVGDATSEPADRLHLLGLAHLLLDPLLLCDVSERREMASGQDIRRERQLHASAGAVGSDEADLEAGRRVATSGSPRPLAHRTRIEKPRQRAADERGALEADERTGRSIDLLDRPAAVHDAERVRRVLEQGVEEPLASPEGLFGQLPVGDVPNVHRDEDAPAEANGNGGELEPRFAAVAPPRAHLHPLTVGRHRRLGCRSREILPEPILHRGRK
jgi:hypothetical protein